MPLSSFSTPSWDMESSGKSGKSGPCNVGISKMFYLVKTDTNWLFRILVRFSRSVINFPLWSNGETPEKSCLWARTYLQNGLWSLCSRPTWRTLFICFQRCRLMALRVSLLKVQYCCQYLFDPDLLALLNSLCFFLHIRFNVLLNQGMLVIELVILIGIWQLIKDWTLLLKEL